MATPISHHNALGVHPGAFVQNTAPSTVDVQDGVLWVDTSSGPPYQLMLWDQTSATWLAVGSVAGTSTGSAVDSLGQLHTPCLLFLSHGASICNDTSGVVDLYTPMAQYTFDDSAIVVTGGHRLERYQP